MLSLPHREGAGGDHGSPGEQRRALCICPAARFDWVRLGIALYGYDPAGRVLGATRAGAVGRGRDRAGARGPAQDAGRLRRALGRRAARAGSAIVPVGYADGYSWRLGNRAEVLVAGQRVPVVGAVSMDLLALDVTGVGAEVGTRPRSSAARAPKRSRRWSLPRRSEPSPTSCSAFSACACRGAGRAGASKPGGAPGRLLPASRRR